MNIKAIRSRHSAFWNFCLRASDTLAVLLYADGVWAVFSANYHRLATINEVYVASEGHCCRHNEQAFRTAEVCSR